MTLLNTLQSKDEMQELFDTNINSSTMVKINHNSNSNNHTNENDNNKLSSVDVVLCGLKFIIPLMNQEMLKVRLKFEFLVVSFISKFYFKISWLKFQALCHEYFKLISSIADSYPNKLFSTSIELYSALVNSIEYGINS